MATKRVNRPYRKSGRPPQHSETVVRRVRRLVQLRRKLTNKALARRFGMSESCIRHLLDGRIYKWVR